MDECSLLIPGTVGKFIQGQDKGVGEEERKLAELGAGETVGEMGMIEVFPRSATAVALDDETALTEVGEKELNEFFQSKPDQLLKIMKQISKRIRETNEKYLNVCHVVYENTKAEKSGAEKSEWLKEQLNAICAEHAQHQP